MLSCGKWRFIGRSVGSMFNLRKAFLLVPVLILAAALPVLAQNTATPEATESAAMTPLDKIEINQAGLFPEGIEWDAAGSRFLVSSLSGQGINAVADDGTLTPFADAENKMSIVGLQIDSAHKRLLAAYSDASVFSDTSVKGQAALGIY